MNLNSFFVLDDLFSDNYVKTVEKLLINSPWKYIDNITSLDEEKNLQNGFSFLIEKNFFQYPLFQYLIFNSCDKINFNVHEILRVRKRLTYPNKEKYNIPYQPHVDFNKKHLVLIYYVNESDGNTFIYKEKYKKEDKNKDISDLTLLESIDFKKGRVVIFDGKNYHASSLSSKNKRVILNVNLSGKFL